MAKNVKTATELLKGGQKPPFFHSHPPPKTKILWIASYPKSGNTWMRAFLANLINGGDKPVALNDIASFCPSEADHAFYKPYLKGQKIEDMSERQLVMLRPLIQQNIANQFKVNVPLKTHSSYGIRYNTPLISDALSLAAVYIIRDPRDVIVSSMSHFNMTQSQMINIMNFKEARLQHSDSSIIPEFVGSWSNHVLSWADDFKGPKFIIRYEDLLEKPYDIFAKLANELGISKDEHRIKRAMTFSSFKELQKNEEKQSFVERPHQQVNFFRKGQAGVWKELLSKQDERLIIKHHGDVMRRFGYI